MFPFTPQQVDEILGNARTPASFVQTDEEVKAEAPASLTISNVDISQNTTGLDESLGFNTETGQHTVARPGLSGVFGHLWACSGFQILRRAAPGQPAPFPFPVDEWRELRHVMDS